MSRSICLLPVVLLLTTASYAQTPESISFQGYLTDNLDQPVDSAGWNITFQLYKEGRRLPIWSETQSVDIVDGIFNVYLGAVTPLDTVTFDQPIDLGMKLDGESSEISPRTPLVATAFAMGLRGFYTYYRSDGVNNSYNIVGGHQANSVDPGAVGATIGGGGKATNPNQVLGDFGTVGGGYSNTAHQRATVGGGINNIAKGTAATVGGGDGNTARGEQSTVPGGALNQARGDMSLAAGWQARANHGGSFVWQDFSAAFDDTLASTGNNQFLARASGGFFFYTAAAPALTTGISLPAGSGTWTGLSSENSKTNFREIDTRSYLSRVVSLDLKEWSYKTERGVTHVGPMAEDFYAAFGLGPTEKGISGVDGDGVALAAIQGLYALVKQQQAEIERLKAEVAGLR